jgi:hypothetical protein
MMGAKSIHAAMTIEGQDQHEKGYPQDKGNPPELAKPVPSPLALAAEASITLQKNGYLVIKQ